MRQLWDSCDRIVANHQQCFAHSKNPSFGDWRREQRPPVWWALGNFKLLIHLPPTIFSLGPDCDPPRQILDPMEYDLLVEVNGCVLHTGELSVESSSSDVRLVRCQFPRVRHRPTIKNRNPKKKGRRFSLLEIGRDGGTGRLSGSGMATAAATAYLPSLVASSTLAEAKQFFSRRPLLGTALFRRPMFFLFLLVPGEDTKTFVCLSPTPRRRGRGGGERIQCARYYVCMQHFNRLPKEETTLYTILEKLNPQPTYSSRL